MKKIYNLSISKILILAVIFISAANVGQSQVLLNEDFSSGLLPTNWTQSSVSVGDAWEYGGSVDFGAASIINDPFNNSGEYAHIDFSDDPDTTSLITPIVDISTLTTPRLTFYYISQTTSISFSPYNRLIVDYWDGTSWINITVIDTLTTLGWTEYDFNISTYTFGTDSVQFRFSAQEGGAAIGGTGTATFDQDLALDDVTIEETPTCLEPTGIVASTVQDTSITFSWTENNTATQWEIEWETTANFNLGTKNTSIINTDTFTILNGLNAATDYTFRVRAICVVGDTSFFSIPVSVLTNCATYISPYTEAFDSFTPVCWDQAGDGTPLNGFTGLGTSDWRAEEYLNTLANGGGAAINLFSNSDEEWILSPNFDLSVGGPHELLIDAGVTNWLSAAADNMGSDDTVQVLISSDAGVTWNVLETWDATNQPPTLGQTYIIDLSTYTGTDYIFAIWATDGAVNDPEDYDFHIGNFEIRPRPSCPEATALDFSNITDSSVVISWTEGGTASDWIVEWDTSGFTAGTGLNSVVINTDTFTTITGLNGNTSYDFYVRAICAAADTSNYSSLGSATTLCVSFVAPFSEDFNALSIPDCWSQGAGNSEDWEFQLTDGHIGNVGNQGTGSTTSGGGLASVDDSSPHNTNTSLVTPLIDVSGLTTPRLNFFTISDNEGNLNGNVDFHVDVYDGANWNDSLFFSDTNTLNGTWEQIFVDLSQLTITGPIQIRFVVDENNGTLFDDDRAIDDVVVEETPLPYYAIGTINGEDSLGVADSLNVNCRISGTVTGVDRRGGGYEFALIDLSSGFQEGITVFDFNDLSNYSNPTEGDSLEIYGSVDQFNGLTQFRPDSIIILDSGNATVPTPNLVTNLDETTESKLVELNDKFVLLDPSGSFSYNMDATNGTDTITIRVDSDTDVNDSLNIAGNALIAGDTICALIGIGGQFDNSSPYDDGYQVFPSRYSDITICRLACIDPTALSSTNVSSDSASLSWTANGAAINWEISYGATGFTAGNGTQVIVNSIPFNLLNLSQNTAYDWYVRSICGVGDTSNWSDTSSFTTLAIPLPYYPIGTINTVDTIGVGDSIGVEMQTSGTVVGVDLDGNNGLNFYIIDMSSSSQEGINIFNFNDVSNYVVTEGDSIRVWGEVDQFNGQQQIFVDSIEVISTNAFVPAARGVNNLDESTEANHISLTDDFVLLDASGTFSYNMDATNGIDTITIRVDADTDVNDSLNNAGQNLVVGDTICGLSGVGGQFDNSSPFDGGYQVFPMRFSDITICRLAVGLNDVAPEQSTFSIVPNPSSGEFSIRTSGFNNESVRIQIRDISGRMVMDEIVINAQNQMNKTIHLNENAKGIYFISIFDGDQIINQKLILK